MIWLALGMAGLSLAGAGAQNASARKAYNAQNAALSLQQQENNVRLLEATEEARRAGAMAIIDDKTVMNETIGKEMVRRGEGATAGNSASRSIQMLTINSEKAISKEQTNQRKNLINMWQQNEQTNMQIQQAKEQARAQAKANSVSQGQAIMGAGSAGVSGYMMGKQLAEALKGAGSPTISPGSGIDTTAPLGGTAGPGTQAVMNSNSYWDVNTQSWIKW